MMALERILIDFLLNFVSREDLNAFLLNPQNTAVLVGSFIAIAGALLGTFLLLRGLALTSDAISHTVLLGIVVAFMIMTSVFDLEPDTSSIWLIIGAAGAGVLTVILTELLAQSGLVRHDAALGLAFPLLFAIAVILISRYVDDVHLDEDAVMVGEIGVAFANTNSHCFTNCETVTINEGDPEAEMSRQCTNCRAEGISPRDEGAQFVEVCNNCREYSPAEAFQAGLTDAEPVQVFFPKSIMVTAVLMLLTVGFVTLFYKELKLATFDAALAKALGFHPAMLNYALMVLVSLVAVGAFDAVGSVLVIAFFIIPPAAAYLLTDRLSLMLLLSPIIGAMGAFFGYDLARGDLFGVLDVDIALRFMNDTFGMNLTETWDSSISASMVIMIFLLFCVAWVLSPKYGLVSTLLKRANQRQRFDNVVVLGHIQHHQDTEAASTELNAATLHEHFHWSHAKMTRVLTRLRALNFVTVDEGEICLTEQGQRRLSEFRDKNLASQYFDI